MTTACKNFVKDHATHHMQLSYLPYFNLVEQIMIDLIYNLFLGMFSIFSIHQAYGCILTSNRASQDMPSQPK